MSEEENEIADMTPEQYKKWIFGIGTGPRKGFERKIVYGVDGKQKNMSNKKQYGYKKYKALERVPIYMFIPNTADVHNEDKWYKQAGFIDKGKIFYGREKFYKRFSLGNMKGDTTLIMLSGNTFVDPKNKNIMAINSKNGNGASEHANFSGADVFNKRTLTGTAVGALAGGLISYYTGKNQLWWIAGGAILGGVVGHNTFSPLPMLKGKDDEHSNYVTGCNSDHSSGSSCTTKAGISGKWGCFDFGAGPTWGCDTGAGIIEFEKKRSKGGLRKLFKNLGFSNFNPDPFDSVTDRLMPEKKNSIQGAGGGLRRRCNCQKFDIDLQKFVKGVKAGNKCESIDCE